MSKLLVIPSPATATSLLSAAAAAAGPLVPTRVPTVREQLALRNVALTTFGQLALMQSALASSMARTAAAVSTKGLPTFQVLEGVGAIVVDEADIDRVALAQHMGATVLDDVDVPLIAPTPIVKTSAAMPNFWHQRHIALPAAQAKGLTGADVLVGVLDTGIDTAHGEFLGKTVYFEEFDRSGSPISGGVARDAGSHGTHVCGLVAGVNAGVAPSASLAVAAVLTIAGPTGMGGGLVQIASGLNWLLTHSFRGPNNDPGVDVLNASLGASGYNAYLYSPLSAARISPGTLLIAAIGNDGRFGVNHHGSPGNYDIVVGVGAHDPSNVVAPFSDWGTVPQHSGLAKPDLCAPGVDVWSSVPGGAYAALSGTSMASPIACGAAALCLQQNPAHALNVPALQARLLGLVAPLPGQAARGGAGRLDLTSI